MIIRLNYFPIEGKFQLASAREASADAAYSNLYPLMSEEAANNFIRNMTKKFPQLDCRNLDSYPNFEDMQDELQHFLAEASAIEIEAQEKQSTRRFRLFRKKS